MDCTYCNEELELHDYYGQGIPGNNNFKKIGDIFKCINEDCESEIFNYFFYTNLSGQLFEGYPC